MEVLVFAIGFPVIVYVVYCLYMKSVKKRCTCITDLTGKTVIVTGSDKGKYAHSELISIICSNGNMLFSQLLCCKGLHFWSLCLCVE